MFRKVQYLLNIPFSGPHWLDLLEINFVKPWEALVNACCPYIPQHTLHFYFIILIDEEFFQQVGKGMAQLHLLQKKFLFSTMQTSTYDPSYRIFRGVIPELNSSLYSNEELLANMDVIKSADSEFLQELNFPLQVNPSDYIPDD